MTLPLLAMVDSTHSSVERLSAPRTIYGQDVLPDAPLPPGWAPLASVRQWLRRSQLAYGVVLALRGAGKDLQVLRWLAARGSIFRAYLRSSTIRSLHLGAGNNLLAGWLNTDVDVANSSITYLDATRRFPFADKSFDYIAAEHMIEHIGFEQGLSMLVECFRILKIGGRIRLATPDLATLLALHTGPRSAQQQRYVNWMVERQMPWIDACKEVFVINTVFRSWGHQFLYDRGTISMALTRAGFSQIRFFAPGVSGDLHLCGIESHGIEIQAEDINQFETMVVEGTKVAASVPGSLEHAE